VSADPNPGWVVWFTGRPSSGKSTLARRVAEALRERDQPAVVLDGDAVRKAIVPPFGYDENARQDFYTTLANLAAVLAAQGLIVLVPATAHRARFREYARKRASRFIEVYVDTAPDAAEQRDSKGLYQAARSGRVRDLPGADLEFEPPPAPEVHASGGKDQAAMEQILCLVVGGAMSDLHELLIRDHRRVERLFRELENAVEGADQATVAHSYGEFERALLAHFETEEQLLFPVLEPEHPGEVARARREHEQVRALLAELGVRADLHLLRKAVADQLVARLREHGDWEDHTLYPWFAAAAGRDAAEALQRTLARAG
jgi:adenylylsulfate kinase